LAISLETRLDRLEESLWSPYFIANDAGIAFEHPDFAINDSDQNLVRNANNKIKLILNEFFND
jgi:hypothetical protein